MISNANITSMGFARFRANKCTTEFLIKLKWNAERAHECDLAYEIREQKMKPTKSGMVVRTLAIVLLSRDFKSTTLTRDVCLFEMCVAVVASIWKKQRCSQFWSSNQFTHFPSLLHSFDDEIMFYSYNVNNIYDVLDITFLQHFCYFDYLSCMFHRLNAVQSLAIVISLEPQRFDTPVIVSRH